jgi:hypothetical protein
VEEQLLQIKFDWPVRLAHPMEVITPWPHMPNLIQLVQGTEHGSVISLPFARTWKNNSSKSSSTGQFDWPMAIGTLHL